MRKTGLALVGALAGLICLPASAAAVTLEPIGTATYAAPTYVTSDPTNPDRLFVTEQAGTIDVTTPSGTAVFLDLADKVNDSGSEQGLWSMAFAPDFATSRRFYVAYSDAASALTLDEYTEASSAAETEATRRQVLAIPNSTAPGFANHNGGQLQFGPDGYLYWSTGEDNMPSNAQTTTNLLGKILRIDPRGGSPGAYSVPPDNPFVADAGSDEIWAYGLRNPWRFSFDRATGAMYVADVGAGSLEEINLGAEGANYGWPVCEGPCGNPAFVDPIHTYVNDATTCAITGGYVVRDPDLGDLFGRYLFADFCEGQLRSIDPATGAHRYEGLAATSPTSFGEDACGRLYVVSRAGQVFRIEGPTGGACPQSPELRDTRPPETSLKLKRKNERGTEYVARIGSSEPNSTFECKLDRRQWKPCAPKRKLKRLDPGRHRFRARATDAAGNTDPSPAKKRFRTIKP